MDGSTGTPHAPETSVDPGGDPTAAPVADPFDDVDALEDLEEEICRLAAHIHAATYRLLVLLADFDRRRGWELGGHRSCAHWLHRTTGIDLGACRERVRVARALESLPRTSEVMSRGELSFSQVRALSRVATAECEEELLEVARHTTTAELEEMIRQWRLGALGGGGADAEAEEEEKLERRRYRLRRLAVFPDEGGMYVVRGRLPAEVGALLMRAVEAATDALFREESGATAETTPEQRRADALGLLAERGLAAGFVGAAGKEAADGDPGADGAEAEPEDGSAETPGRQDAPLGAPVPVSGTRPERYQVFVHLEPAALRKEGDTEGDGSAIGADGIVARALVPRSHLEDGTRLCTATARRICCDAAVVRVLTDPGGEILDLGRKQRTVSGAQRRALEIRDGGCRWPGCGLRFTDAHHLVHWACGGKTDLDNLILLCGFHHRTVHEGGWRVEFWGRERWAAFIDPLGRIHMEVGAGDAGAASAGVGAPGLEARPIQRPPRPELPDRPWEALVREHEALGIEPALWKLGRGWRTDLPWPVHARALEALDDAHWEE